MADRTERENRLKIANQIITIISSHGRKFFSHDGRVSRFELHPDGKLYLIDKYTQKPIYTAYRRGSWRNFSEGGTLRDLICNLHDFIMRGAPIQQRFGPWPEWICDGDLWGYGDSMETVRREIAAVILPIPGAQGGESE